MPDHELTVPPRFLDTLPQTPPHIWIRTIVAIAMEHRRQSMQSSPAAVARVTKFGRHTRKNNGHSVLARTSNNVHAKDTERDSRPRDARAAGSRVYSE